MPAARRTAGLAAPKPPMKRSLALCFLASGSLLTAQSVTSPLNAYSLSEGGGSCTTFGAYAAGRYQFADDNFSGSAMSVSELAFRHDHSSYTVQDGMGRSFSNVTVFAAETNYASFGTTFASNATTTPVRVFDSSLSWPIQLGPTMEVPATWDVTVPFTSSFAYTGTGALMTDFTFTGGTLANSAAWSGTNAVPYRLDSFNLGHTAEGPPVTLGRVNGGCVDSSASSPVGASLRLVIRAHGPSHPNPTLQNQFYIEATGKNFAPSSSVLMFLAFRGEVQGFTFPFITCNDVHLPLGGRMWFPHPVMADAVGNIAPYNLGAPGGLAPFTPAWHGIPVFAQGMWDDTTTTALKFSAGSRNSFMALPVPTVADSKLKVAYDPNPAASTAGFSAEGDSNSIPIFRYTN